MSRGWLARSLVAGLGIFVALIGWAFMGPSRLGGGASYAVIAGTSMTPTLRAGDLAILREAEEYRVGDIVGYRSEFGQVVVHRVTAREGEQLSLKGDANSWTDSAHPARRDIVGKLLGRAPGLGGVITWLRSPAGLIVLGLITAAALGLFIRGKAPKPREAVSGSPGIVAPPLVTLVAATTVCFMLLGILAFTRPLSGVSSFTAAYRHQGQFSYSARSAVSGVYEGSGATTGEPVFLRIAPAMDVRFVYRLESRGEHMAAGTSRIVAELSDASGWKRRIEVAPEVPFDGDEVHASATVDLRRVWDLIHQAEALTGLPRGGYALAIIPDLNVRGSVAGLPFEDRFTPRLGFRLDALQLTMDTPAGDSAATALAPTKDGATRGTHVAPRTIKIVGANVSVRSARVFAVTGLIIALAAAAIASRRRASRRPPTAEPDQIRGRYGDMLLPVRSAGASAFKRVIDLEDIDVLAQIAERGGGIIFHEQRGGMHSYLVPEGDIAYRYVAEGETAPSDHDPEFLQQPQVPDTAEHAGILYRPSSR